ncbi:unnamed protein product [Urochloa humidicola]
MGRRRVASRADVVEVTLVGISGDDSQVQGLTGTSTRRSSKRQNVLFKEKVEVRDVSARCSVSQVYEVMQGLSDGRHTPGIRRFRRVVGWEFHEFNLLKAINVG